MSRRRIWPQVRAVLALARRHRGAVAGMVLAKLLLAAVALAPPWLLGLMVDRVLSAGEQRLLPLVVGGLLAVVVFETAVTFLQTWLRNIATNWVTFGHRANVFRRALHTPLHSVRRAGAGDLRVRVEEDTDALSEVLTNATELLFSAVVLVSHLVVCVLIRWELAAAGVVLSVGLYLLSRVVARKTGEAAEALRVVRGDRSNHLHELIQGWKDIRTLGIERRFREMDLAYSERMVRGVYRQRFWNYYVRYTLRDLREFVVARLVMYVLGAWQILAGQLTVGSLLAFVRYFERVVEASEEIVGLLTDFERTAPSVRRSLEVGTWPTAQPIRPDRGAAPVALAANALSFAYEPERPVVDRIDLSVPEGRAVALVGASGSGKTTLVRMLAGLQTPAAGTIALGGRDVTLAPERRVAECAVAMQDSVLFNLSIRENLQLADPHATDAEILAACEAARIAEFVGTLEAGLDTVIGERGIRLSGGQRQRFVIARTLLLQRPIVILDEATSQVDEQNDAAIQDALLALRPAKTLLIVAHRLNTIVGADDIVVCAGGRVVAEGTHDELMIGSEVYQDLFRSQLGAS